MCQPLRLENGDIIVIPERSQTVLVQGEVGMPQAVVWREGWSGTTIWRPRRADGARLAQHADDPRPSGAAMLNPTQPPQPGDDSSPCPYLDPKYWQFGQDLVTALFQVALAARVFD